MKLVVINKSKLVPLEDNPRKLLDKEGHSKLIAMIKEHGFQNPLQVWRETPDTEFIILCGNHRFAAGLEIGLDKFPCIIYEGSRAKALSRAISDNKSSEYTGWDKKKLKEMMEEITLLDGLSVDEITGFSIDEIDELLADATGDSTSTSKDDAAPAVDETVDPISRSGDIWSLGRHRLMCGDATSKKDIELLLDGKNADMIFTDPPCGINIVKSNKEKGSIGHGGTLGFVGAGGIVPVNAYKPIKGDDTTDTAHRFYNLFKEKKIAMIIWGGNYFSDFLPPSSCWICWDKRVDIPSNNFADCELAWTNIRASARIYRHVWSGLLRKGNRKDELIRRVHPTQKPVGLAEWCLKNYSKANDIIIDGFGGSGSTLIACEKTDRICKMVEYEPHYCDVILRRYADFSGVDPVRQDGIKWSSLCQSDG